MNAKRILIIEDEADIQEALAETFTDANFTVLTAPNGAVGLDMAITEQPDLLLLDLKMPVMDGHEVLRRLRGARTLMLSYSPQWMMYKMSHTLTKEISLITSSRGTQV